MTTITIHSTDDWREYWRSPRYQLARPVRTARCHRQSPTGRIVVVGFIMTCSICGAWPCANPSFCRACRDTDRRKARGEPPRYIEPSRCHEPSDRIPDNWREMSIEALIAHFDRARRRDGAPQRTVEALMFSLRERGAKALEEADIKRRLSDFSDQQVIEVGNRLQKLKPDIARAWNAREVETLFQARLKR